MEFQVLDTEPFESVINMRKYDTLLIHFEGVLPFQHTLVHTEIWNLFLVFSLIILRILFPTKQFLFHDLEAVL
ncbi:hypothetical protein X975_21277, partial [Stegodyphus mimosarum]